MMKTGEVRNGVAFLISSHSFRGVDWNVGSLRWRGASSFAFMEAGDRKRAEPTATQLAQNRRGGEHPVSKGQESLKLPGVGEDKEATAQTGPSNIPREIMETYPESFWEVAMAAAAYQGAIGNDKCFPQSSIGNNQGYRSVLNEQLKKKVGQRANTKQDTLTSSVIREVTEMKENKLDGKDKRNWGRGVALEKSLGVTDVEICEEQSNMFVGRNGAVTADPLEKGPPGGPFDCSKQKSWHVQQVVQSAVTPLQAMRTVLDRPSRCNYVTVVTAINKVAKLQAERNRRKDTSVAIHNKEVTQLEDKYLGVLLQVAEELIDGGHFNARSLATLTWSVAKLSNPDIDPRAIEQPEEGTQEIGSLRFGVHRLQESLVGGDKRLDGPTKKSRLLTKLADRLSEQAPHLKPLEIGMVCWGLAVLEQRNEKCLAAIAKEVTNRAVQFKGNELSNVLWAFAVLDYGDKAMLDAVAKLLSPSELVWPGRVSWEWTGQCKGDDEEEGSWRAVVCHSAKGFAKDDIGVGPIHADDEDSVDLAMVTDAELAEKLHSVTGDMDKVDVGLVTLSPQELSTIAWGMSSLSKEWLPGQPAAYRALSELTKAAVGCVHTFNSQDISMLALSMARLSWDSPVLMKAMASRAMEILREFRPQELTNIIWAFARLNHKDERLMEAATGQAHRMLNGLGLKPQELANLAWSMAVLDSPNKPLLRAIMMSAQDQQAELTVIDKHQLYQVYLLWNKDISYVWKGVDIVFLKHLRTQWEGQKERLKRSSSTHLGVSETLKLMQIAHENESDHDIDIEVVGIGLKDEDWDFRKVSMGSGPNLAQPSKVRMKVALEVDGPAHFTRNTIRPLGHMVLKHRTLAKIGWTVVTVPFFEWDSIPVWASMEKKRYLQRKMGIRRTIFFGGRDQSEYKGWSPRVTEASRYY